MQDKELRIMKNEKCKVTKLAFAGYHWIPVTGSLQKAFQNFFLKQHTLKPQSHYCLSWTREFGGFAFSANETIMSLKFK